jgi:hypothetical protein
LGCARKHAYHNAITQRVKIMAELIESGNMVEKVTISQNKYGDYGIFADDKMIIRLSIIELLELEKTITDEIAELRTICSWA